MKIFGSLDTPLPAGQARTLVGRQVANIGFLHALWRYGDFDRYHFFAGDEHDARQFLDAHRETLERLGLVDRVQVHSRFSLLDQLAATPYHVFHQSDFITWLGPLCHLRSRHAPRRFPVTAPIHSISYPAYLETYLRLMIEGPEAYDAVICTSEAGRAAIREAFARVASHPRLAPLSLARRMRLELIPLGVDPERFRPASEEERRAAKRALGWSPDAPVTLCLGRFSEADKYDVLPLLRAFQGAIRSASGSESGGAPGGTGPGAGGRQAGLEGARLVIAGARQGNNYPERIVQIAGSMGLGSHVSIQVDLSADQHRDLYRAADLFVSPSDNLQETFGLTVLEAMAAGLPVIASDWDGYKDLVEHEKTGLRVPVLVGGWDGLFGELGPVSYERPWHLAVAQGTIVDVPALEAALRRLLIDAGLRRIMGEAGARRAALFTWERVIGRHLELWRELHDEAARDTRPAPSPSPFAQPPFALFPQHPTGTLPSHARLSLTDLGEALLRTPDARPWYLELEPLFDITVLRHICAAARRGSGVGETVSEVAEAQGIPADRVAYQLAWLLKRDLVRVNG